MIEVVNKYTHKREDSSSTIYIGRGSVLGNPYTHKKLNTTKALYQCDSLEEVLESYRNYLTGKIKEKDAAICEALNKIYKDSQQKGVFLVCYCKPKKCHGDIIKEIVEGVNK